MSKKSMLWVGGAALILLCCASALGLTLWQGQRLLQEPALLELFDDSLVSATPTPQPVIERSPVARPEPTAPAVTPTGASSTLAQSATAEPPEPAATLPSPNQATLSTEQVLIQALLPERDQRLLAMRLKHKGQEIPKTIEASPSYQLGDIDTLWVTDNQQTPPRQFQVEARLEYMTDHSYWWVEQGMDFDEAGLARSAEQFEEQTYPTNRAFFGSEWSPGVDNDQRVHIFMGNVPGVAGYFSASNSYSKLAEPYSNEREMFFINLRSMTPGSDYFDGVLAHEFQHMIHWYQDRNEDTWVNEGLSELATFLNGYGLSSFVGVFSRVPDTQLNSWADSPNASLANYGASFLFMAYFLQEYGEEMMRAVVSHPENGIAGFNVVLAEEGYPERFEEIFADFLVANYLADPTLAEGQWGYQDFTINPVTLSERYALYPVEQQATVYQHGADYIELSGEGELTLEFTGSTRVRVVDNQAHSGDYQWYSHRGDDTNTRLTRTFDLRGVDTATLNYWTWYDIESDWDYGYIEISTDGGQTWTILQTPHSSTTNPSGNAFGPGYTGRSGGGEQPIWIEESLDLTTYADQEVQIRFEYVTDDAVNRPGWTIDDIRIPEIDFFDDVESGPNGWQAEGFVAMDNILSQRFLVQLLEIGEEPTLRPVPLDETNYGQLTISGLGRRLERAILIVSGLTPVTTQPASYEYKVNR